MAALVSRLAWAEDFSVKSPSVVDDRLTERQVLNAFGCAGADLSPALAWSAPPPGTKSLAVTIYDPDAPTGSGWWHWVAFNLPADLRALPEGAGDPNATMLPSGAVQSRTDFGIPGYGGACPPEQDAPHRYQMTVWALDVDHLDLDANASGAMVGFFLRAHAVGQATLTALYGR
ncbi:MAG TPA: YbhB/YbcL family Raf kinase inhibitor-like protein [Dongiaceae bacterium]|nr:YbhB/YbcL family Raf kinase inhibitor-like protein [Dongiaceae bacterium]